MYGLIFHVSPELSTVRSESRIRFYLCGQAFIALLRGLRARTQTRRNSVCRIVHMRERVSECAFNTGCIDPLIALLRCGIACAQTRHDSVRRIVCM